MFSRCSIPEKGRTVISNVRVHVSEQQLGEEGQEGREDTGERGGIQRQEQRTVGYFYMYEWKHNFPSSDS